MAKRMKAKRACDKLHRRSLLSAQDLQRKSDRAGPQANPTEKLEGHWGLVTFLMKKTEECPSTIKVNSCGKHVAIAICLQQFTQRMKDNGL